MFSKHHGVWVVHRIDWDEVVMRKGGGYIITAIEVFNEMWRRVDK